MITVVLSWAVGTKAEAIISCVCASRCNRQLWSCCDCHSRVLKFALIVVPPKLNHSSLLKPCVFGAQITVTAWISNH